MRCIVRPPPHLSRIPRPVRRAVRRAAGTSPPCRASSAMPSALYEEQQTPNRHRRVERAVHHHAGIPVEALNHRGAALPRESGRPTGGARVPDFWAVWPGARDSPQADVPGPRGPKRLFCSKYLARACVTGCCPRCPLASDWHNIVYYLSTYAKIKIHW